jgi:hypothetical protein
LPHATEDLYDANGAQLTPTVWDNHSVVDTVQVYQTSDSLGQESIAIDNENGDKTQVFNPEGTALVIADTIARKEDIFVDDSGQKVQYYPFEYQDVSPLSGDSFDGIDSLEYRESGFNTNFNYFVDQQKPLIREVEGDDDLPVYRLTSENLISMPNVDSIAGGAALSADGNFYASFKINIDGSVGTPEAYFKEVFSNDTVRVSFESRLDDIGTDQASVQSSSQYDGGRLLMNVVDGDGGNWFGLSNPIGSMGPADWNSQAFITMDIGNTYGNGGFRYDGDDTTLQGSSLKDAPLPLTFSFELEATDSYGGRIPFEEAGVSFGTAEVTGGFVASTTPEYTATPGGAENPIIMYVTKYDAEYNVEGEWQTSVVDENYNPVTTSSFDDLVGQLTEATVFVKDQVVDYRNDPNTIDEAIDKHDVFEFSDVSSPLSVDDQVYPFEYKDGSDLADGTDVYTMEVRDPFGYDISQTLQTYFVDDADGNRIQVTDATGDQYSMYAVRKEDLFAYDGSTPDVEDQVFDFTFKDGSDLTDGTNIYTMEVRNPYGDEDITQTY